MSEQSPTPPTPPTPSKPQKAAAVSSKMEKIVALCKRRGFIFQSSEIYGGINGFWDYGPLGVELKRNLKEAWWQDIVRCPPMGPDGEPVEMVPLDCTIIMNPKVWVASGHAAGFNDPMVDDKETKQRFRADHLFVVVLHRKEEVTDVSAFWHTVQRNISSGQIPQPAFTAVASTEGELVGLLITDNKLFKPFTYIAPTGIGGEKALRFHDKQGAEWVGIMMPIPVALLMSTPEIVPSPFTQKRGV